MARIVTLGMLSVVHRNEPIAERRNQILDMLGCDSRIPDLGTMRA